MARTTDTPEPTQTVQAPVRPQTAGQLVNPHTDPAQYLLSKGWRCLGNPAWESALWMDPEQPLRSYYTEEPCMYPVEVREEYVDPNTQQLKVRYKTEQRQVLAQDGRGGAAVAARRQRFHPKGNPMSMSAAMMLQLERDAEATLAAEEARINAEFEASKKRAG